MIGLGWGLGVQVGCEGGGVRAQVGRVGFLTGLWGCQVGCVGSRVLYMGSWVGCGTLRCFTRGLRRGAWGLGWRSQVGFRGCQVSFEGSWGGVWVSGVVPVILEHQGPGQDVMGSWVEWGGPRCVVGNAATAFLHFAEIYSHFWEPS